MSLNGEDSPGIDDQDANKSGLSAPKNKRCQWCHESFTSSSLGRHLDLFIKQKNPKPPDGIHDVEKIRQIRGGITRRQPKRNTRVAESSSTPVSGIHTTSSLQNAGSPYIQSENGRGPVKWHMNKPTWEATGVMTDIPPTPTLGLDNNLRKHLARSDLALRKHMNEDRLRLRATELALQELLDSVVAARTQAHPKTPFEFEFLSQTFPALCLKLLPKQPSLHSPQVFENAKYCSIGPPGQVQFDLLRKSLEKTLHDFVSREANIAQRRASLRSTISGASSLHQDSEELNMSMYTTHLQQAWELWNATPEDQRVSMWQLETLRALSDSQAEQRRLSDALSKAEANQEHLRIQIQRLNDCQQPKEYTFQIPSNWHVSKETASVLDSDHIDTPPDRETLIAKWAAVVRKDNRFQRAMPEYGLTDVSTDPDGMDVESRGTPDDGDDDDGDSADAAGDDDDEGSETNLSMQPEVNRPNHYLRQGNLDPNLRNSGTSMDLDR